MNSEPVVLDCSSRLRSIIQRDDIQLQVRVVFQSSRKIDNDRFDTTRYLVGVGRINARNYNAQRLFPFPQ